MEISLQELNKIILDTYYEVTGYKRIDLNIEFVEDIFSRKLELEHSEYIKKEIKKNKHFIKQLNGTIILPPTLDGKYSILTSTNALSDMRFMGTICHELTHIHDYIDFTNEFCNGDISLINTTEPQGIFYYWTEFHARRMGYFFYRTLYYILNNVELSKEEQLEHIRTTEYQLHYKTLYDDIWKAHHNNDNTKYLYSVVNFMGRVSAWRTIFKNELDSDEFIPDYLVKQYGDKIFKLFHLLESMRDFNIAKEKFEELEQQLNNLLS